MSCFSKKTLTFLLCLSFLVVMSQVQKVDGLNSIDLALKGHYPVLRRSRTLQHVAVHDLSNAPSLAPAPSTTVLHPDQSSKRRVRRGSDPIHNRC